MRPPLLAWLSPPNTKLPYALLKGRGVEGCPCLGQLFHHHDGHLAGLGSHPASQLGNPGPHQGGSEAGAAAARCGDIISQLHRSWQRSWPVPATAQCCCPERQRTRVSFSVAPHHKQQPHHHKQQPQHKHLLL